MEKSTESAKKQDEKQPNQVGSQATQAKDGGGVVKDGNEQAAKKDTAGNAVNQPGEGSTKKEAGAERSKESPAAAGKTGKEGEKAGAEVVRDRGW